jgi:asparaginyl-tRNA synthetase
MSIKTLFTKLNNILDKDKNFIQKSIIRGWVRTVRSSSNILGFCAVNDGSNVNGIQIVLSIELMEEDKYNDFFKNVGIGTYLECIGNVILSPSNGQMYEMQLLHYEIKGKCDDDYPLIKSKMNLDTLRKYIHLRARTNTFGSVFRIRSSLMKILHDFYHMNNFLNLDPNIITINECEGGAGAFQVTEKDISEPNKLELIKNIENKDTMNLSGTNVKENKYDWSTDHFSNPVYLTVSSQLQLEALACSLGNCYTMNKSFRSEHSSTSKHVSEFIHLEIEMINIKLDDLMNISEEMIKYCINKLFEQNMEDLENLDKFISKELINRLKHLLNCEYKRMKYIDIINEINEDIDNKVTNISKLNYGDDMGSIHENYITQKYNSPVFLTHWPIQIKSFYMKQCNDGTCESFDLLMPFGIGELIGASIREDDYDKLINMMNIKGVNSKNLDFYLDLRRFGSCPHGGFGLGFDRLLMLMTGMQSIKDVIPFPVYYKNCLF